MLFVEKVISKLSNEELDLVVGGGFVDEYKGTFGLTGSGAAAVFGKIAAFATVALPVGAVVAVIEYFAISKKGTKEDVK